MKRASQFLSIISVALLLICAMTPAARADDNDGLIDNYYTLGTQDGATITRIGCAVYEGDEYIDSDNKLYRVSTVNTEMRNATLVFVGDEPPPAQNAAALAAAQNKRVNLYCTHSDESYVPTDGTESIDTGGGIYDVARALKTNLEAKGVTVTLDETNHLPHDAGAYRRSHQTAVRLLKDMPSALIDIHRDGIPDPGEYTANINGEKATRVRLLVGRQNQNSAVNREFAKAIKAVADERYPGMIKDIFIGKGSYNQELAPRTLLLEFGTHTIDKERALKSTEYMADVLNVTLFGDTGADSATKTPQTGSNSSGSAAPGPSASVNPQRIGSQAPGNTSRGATTGILWALGIVIVGGVVFAIYATGKGGLGFKLKRTVSEMTGGLMGEKPEDKDKE